MPTASHHAQTLPLRAHRRVIIAASLGTGFEWYDFFLYGSLAGVISRQFFASVGETTGFIFALLTFAAGFAVRPFGALLFGRLGDLVGRKQTFLTTIIIMGTATTLVGVLPNYASAGILAPACLIGLRMLQGLAIGGEYGGAAIYVAEHAPPDQRGRNTSWIQLTANLALLLSLAVIVICRVALGSQFEIWGWRIPFLLSAILLGISVYVRLQLAESPVYRQMIATGSRSRAPVREAFGNGANVKRILAALFGATAGMNVVWYTGQLYVLFFLTQVLKVDPQQVSMLLGCVLLLSTPLYLLFGRMSDRVGRKKIIMLGMALAALTYFPIYRAITHFANPAVEEASERAPVQVWAQREDCGLQFDPVGKHRFVRSCDIAKQALARAGVPYSMRFGSAATVIAAVRIGDANDDGTGVANTVPAFDGTRLTNTQFEQESADFTQRLNHALATAGYPAKADPARVNAPMLLLLLFVLAVYVALVTAPMASWLVELFPPRIRYTSMSVPYHIGAGWFGGFMPAVAFTLVAITGDIYSGLWYPVIVVGFTAIAGSLLLPETAGRGDA
ncbi:MAG TPA: MFS transporter [Steroidobacteraceae bacterium]|nr:MFS transporter [Steroidobacteraceae bacterium]